MLNEITFEGIERRLPKIEKCLSAYGLSSLQEAKEI